MTGSWLGLSLNISEFDLLKVLLLSTGDSKLIEHTVNDNYWGDGGDGKGKNKLGQVLMQVRTTLSEKS